MNSIIPNTVSLKAHHRKILDRLTGGSYYLGRFEMERWYRFYCFAIATRQLLPWHTKSSLIILSSLPAMPYYAVICRVLTSLYFCLSVTLIFTVPAYLCKSWHMSVLKRSRNVVKIEGTDYSEKGAGFQLLVYSSGKRCIIGKKVQAGSLLLLVSGASF